MVLEGLPFTSAQSAAFLSVLMLLNVRTYEQPRVTNARVTGGPGSLKLESGKQSTMNTSK